MSMYLLIVLIACPWVAQLIVIAVAEQVMREFFYVQAKE